jgi:hypothetical protein
MATGSMLGYVSMAGIVPAASFALVKLHKAFQRQEPASREAPRDHTRLVSHTGMAWRCIARTSRYTTPVRWNWRTLLGHPGHTQTGRHQVDDGLHLDGFLRHLGRPPSRVVHPKMASYNDGTMRRGNDHQRLGQHASARRGCGPWASGCASGSASTSGSRATACASPGRKTRGVQHEAGVQLAALQALQLHIAVASISSSATAGALLAKGPHPLRQQIEANRRHKRQSQPPQLAGLRRRAPGQAGPGARQQIARLGQQVPRQRA